MWADDKHVRLYVRFEHKFQCRCYRQCRGVALRLFFDLYCMWTLWSVQDDFITQIFNNYSNENIKGVLLCSFTKSWFCFGGVLEHALMLGGSKIALFFTSFRLLQYLSPQTDTNCSISSGFDEGPPKVSCPVRSSSSFCSMAVHSLGVLPPPTVYLTHKGDESVLLSKGEKEEEKVYIYIFECPTHLKGTEPSPGLSWRCVFSSKPPWWAEAAWLSSSNTIVLNPVV